MGFSTRNSDVVKVKEVGVEDDLFICKYSLQPNTECIKIGFVEKVIVGNTIKGDIFYKFVIVDRDSNVVIGRLFPRGESNEFAKSAIGLNNKLVKIQYEVESYNGEACLNIKSIYDMPEDAINVDEYFRPLKALDESYDYIRKELKGLEHSEHSWDIVKRIIESNKILDKMRNMKCDLYYGRCGGALKVLTDSIRLIKSLSIQKSEQDKMIIFSVVGLYFKYEQYNEVLGGVEEYDLGISRLNSLRKSDKFWKIVSESSTEKFYEDLAKEGRHLFGAMTNIDNPRTYAVKVVVEVIKELYKLERLSNAFNGMECNSYKYIDSEDYIVKLGG